MNIPSRVNPFGYDNSIPPGYTKAAFLESTGTQYIDTEWTGGCTTVTRYSAVWVASYVRYTSFWGQPNSLGNSRGSMWYPNPDKYFNLYACFSVAPVVLGQIYEVKQELCDGNRAIALSVDGTRKGAGADGTYDTTISYKLFYPDASRERLYNFTLSALGELKRDLVPTLDATGRPCMFDLVTYKSFYNVTTTGSDFIAGMTMKSALNLANLPATGGNLTVSLPLAAVFDAAVQVALNTAADNGWTITVQYRESELTTKNIDADFLESTGTQYINTAYIPDDTTGLKGRYCRQDSLDTIEVGMRESASSDTRFYLPRYGGSTGGGFGWGKWYSSVLIVPITVVQSQLNWLNCRKAEAESVWTNTLKVSRELSTLPFMPTRPLFLFASNIAGRASLMCSCQMYELSISQGSEVKHIFIPALDSTGTPCMHDTVSGQNFYNANTEEGAAPFIVGFNTVKKAAISLSQLPATTAGALTVSMPVEVALDANVKAALSIATSRGWTITVRYRESELTTENIDADFLESTGTQYINTGVNFSLAEDCEWDVKAYKTVDNNAYHHIFGYRQTVDGGKICIGASYSSTAGALEIEMGKKSYWGENIDTSVPLEFRANNKVASANGKKITINNTVFDLPINNISIFRRYDIYTSMMVGRVYWLNIYNDGNYVMKVVPALDSTGTPCMHDTVSGQNFYNANTSAGATPFTVGFDTTDKAAVSLSKLPVTTSGALTVSLPAAAEDTTTLVPAAIDIAKARGWTIITQYRED